MATMVAILKINFLLLLLNQEVYWLETWYEASGWPVDQKKLKSFQAEIQDGLHGGFFWTEGPTEL